MCVEVGRKMTKKNSEYRVRIEFERIPIVDIKTNNFSEIDKTVRDVKKKFEGCK